jgi:hypothetical protein
MISRAYALYRKIKESDLEEIYERLSIPKADQPFAEVLAEFGKEIANNPLFESYIRKIGEQEKAYRETADIDSVMRQASFNAQGTQKLDQEKLARRERISEYLSLWLILRFNEMYDIPLHDRVRNELNESGNLRDLADFEKGIIVTSNILEGRTDLNLADSYLPHVHRVMSGIIQFQDKQQATSDRDQNIHKKISPPAKNNKLAITAKDLRFDPINGEICFKENVLATIPNSDHELKRFTHAFFPNGALSTKHFSLNELLQKLTIQTSSLLPLRQDEPHPCIGKLRDLYEYNHARYLKNKLNGLLKPYINQFIVLKDKEFYPNPDLFIDPI